MKDEFLHIFSDNIKRAGSAELIAWMEKTDFFTAPASTKYHGAHEGGLLDHSIKVYRRLDSLVAAEKLDASAETIAICALLHDICKIGLYKIDYKNAKDESGVWQKVPFYIHDDQLPYGHGEKSAYIVSGFMRLTREEAMAIRWHMGGYDDSSKGGSATLSTAFKMYPLALLLHLADMQATYLDEKETTNEL